ncbi:MAG: tail fiber protein [Pirellulales bacterium]|nr:tail fiber protein [Pirellulales bacterium]
MEPFIGQIIMFAGNFAPRGWALCDGQLLPIANNQALFSILGTTYGGDGRTNFALPDLRGRVAVHAGSGPGLSPVALGEKSGNAETVLAVDNLPPHTHVAQVTNSLAVGVSAGAQNTDDPLGALLTTTSENFYSNSPPAGEMAGGSVSGDINVTNQNTGNGTAFSNMSPFVAVNFIIALTGTFPSRN